MLATMTHDHLSIASARLAPLADVTVDATGELRVTLRSETLTVASLTTALVRLCDQCDLAAQRGVVFDLRHVRRIGPQWTLVWAVLIAFARRCPSPCHVESLDDQPAATAAIFCKSGELMRLIDRTGPRRAA